MTAFRGTSQPLIEDSYLSCTLRDILWLPTTMAFVGSSAREQATFRGKNEIRQRRKLQLKINQLLLWFRLMRQNCKWY